MSVSTAEEKKKYPLGFKAKKRDDLKNGRFSTISKNPLILNWKTSSDY
jgi:hypothetical protein